MAIRAETFRTIRRRAACSQVLEIASQLNRALLHAVVVRAPFRIASYARRPGTMPGSDRNDYLSSRAPKLWADTGTHRCREMLQPIYAGVGICLVNFVTAVNEVSLFHH